MTKEFSTHARLGALGTLYYNAMTAFPLALLCAAVFGEFSALRHFHYVRDPAFWINFCICAGMGPLITYSSILCTTFNSPLATSITGNVKDLGLTVAGALLFPGYKATASSVFGLLVSFVGAGIYSLVSLRRASAATGGASPGGGAIAAGAATPAAGSGGGAGGGVGGGGTSAGARGADADADADADASGVLLAADDGRSLLPAHAAAATRRSLSTGPSPRASAAAVAVGAALISRPAAFAVEEGGAAAGGPAPAAAAVGGGARPSASMPGKSTRKGL
jgi:hypothetical protein